MKQPSLNLVADNGNRFAHLTLDDVHPEEQDSLIRLAIEVLEDRHRPGGKLQDPQATKDWLRLRLAERPNEVFGAIFLDTRHRVLATEELFQGTLNGASIHARVIVQRAMAHNCGAVLFYHNHPSGIPEPSQADVSLTERLRSALALIDVRVLDHIVVGSEGAVSLAERGLV